MEKFGAVILLLLVNIILGLSPSDLCLATEKQCKGSYDSNNNFKVECSKSKCESPYGYQCGTEHCSTSENTCKKFLDFRYKLKSLRSLKSRMAIEKIFEIEMKKYELFIKVLKECQVSKYEWQPSDMCANGLNCRLRQELPLRYGEISFLQTPIDCPCDGSYTYECGKDYCAKDKTACDGFLTMKWKNQEATDIDGCGNDNVIISKNSN